MKIGQKELMDMRDDLEKLTKFIYRVEQDELPYFYYCFDTMKNNIELYFFVGCGDIGGLIPLLERDWKASHRLLIGVQNYNLRSKHPDIDPALCIYFANLLAGVGKYFEMGGIET